MRGRFVTFEGGEGVGKSTQLGRAAAWLRAAGIEVVRDARTRRDAASGAAAGVAAGA